MKGITEKVWVLPTGEEINVSEHINDRMSVYKKVFFILLVLDVIGLISAIIALLPTFQKLPGYGQPMMGVVIVMIAVVVAIQLFEILAKVFLADKRSILDSSIGLPPFIEFCMKTVYARRTRLQRRRTAK